MTEYKLIRSPDFLTLFQQNVEGSIAIAQLPLNGKKPWPDLLRLPPLPGSKIISVHSVKDMCASMFVDATSAREFRNAYSRYMRWLTETAINTSLAGEMTWPVGFLPALDEWDYQFIITNGVLQGKYVYN